MEVVGGCSRLTVGHSRSIKVKGRRQDRFFGRREVTVEVVGGCSRLTVGRTRSIIDGGRHQISFVWL